MDAQQLSVFDEPGPVPRHKPETARAGKHHRNAGATEVEAAVRSTRSNGRRAVQVLEALFDAGPAGLIRHEIADHAGILVSSVCGRVDDLVTEGYVERTGRKRTALKTGYKGEVFRITDKGRRHVRRIRGERGAA